MDRRLGRIWRRWIRKGFEEWCLVGVCPGCGKRGPEKLGELCGACELGLDFYDFVPGGGPGGLNWVGVVWGYRGTGGQLVRQGKFMGSFCALGYLARGMLRALKGGGMPGGLLRGDWLVVPVPLSAKKRRRRGFNQAEDLGLRIASRMGWDCASGALRRILETPPLGQVKKAQRATLLMGAFQLGPLQKARVTGRRVLLVDDVITTGATMRACASVLLDAGASRVLGLAACSAVGN
jgi:ComF family protein